MLLSKAFAKIAIKNKIPNSQIINLLDKNIARFDTAYFHYLITKKFLAELTKMLALQLAPHIRVNGIAPSAGFNDTINSKNPAAELERFAKEFKQRRIKLGKQIMFLAILFSFVSVFDLRRTPGDASSAMSTRSGDLLRISLKNLTPDYAT